MPSSSDKGFSVIDYKAIDQKFWFMGRFRPFNKKIQCDD